MKVFIRAITVSLALLLICGIIYPLGMTGVSQLLFPRQANGSIIEYDGKPVGSELLGQAFSDPRFFHGRVSAYNYNTYTEEDTKPDQDGKTAYAGVSSGSANLAPSNPALADRVKTDIDAFLEAHPGVRKEDIPADLLTSSGSGLDPHISPEAAKIQIPAVSRATGINESELEEIVLKYTEGRQLGIFGEPRVNVLKVNMEIAGRLRSTGNITSDSFPGNGAGWSQMPYICCSPNASRAGRKLKLAARLCSLPSVVPRKGLSEVIFSPVLK